MAYSVNQETLVATYNGREFGPMCSDGVHRALTESECAEFKDDIESWEAKEVDRALHNLRTQRTAKLAETDYLALSDQTMSAEMTAYRQALRDLPNNYETTDSGALRQDLSNLRWPTKP